MQLVNITKRIRADFLVPVPPEWSAACPTGLGRWTPGAALFEWFTSLSEDDVWYIATDDKLQTDGNFEGDAPDDVDPEAIAAAAQEYEEVATLCRQQMLQAEALVTPEEIAALPHDMGVPEGYVRLLWERWSTR